MIPYEKITLISQKEHSRVWLASTKQHQTPVVVKEIKKANKTVLESIASIDNIHIPKILALDFEGDGATVMEEYIDGLTLDDYISRNQLSQGDIVGLLLQICNGLEALHSQNPPIIHRDLKPSNLLVSSQGIVKIIDFDASRTYKQESGFHTKTELKDSDWSQDDNHIVSISDDFLSTLKVDYTYEVILDCTEVMVICQLTVIDDLDSVAYPFTIPALCPDNREYLQSQPGDVVLAMCNFFGRKITKIVNTDTGETVNPKYYQIDYDKGLLTVHQEFFDEIDQDTRLHWKCYFKPLNLLGKTKSFDFTFVVRDHAYIEPVLQKRSFICSSKNLQKVTLPLEWNDGKGKLEGVYPREDTSLPAATKDDLQVTDSSIILKKSFLKKLQPGTYGYYAEFGDVGLSFTLTIQ